MTTRDLALTNAGALHDAYRRAAGRRLGNAKRLDRKAQGRGRVVRWFARRELECAKAEAQEWGVAGRAAR